MSQHHGLNRRAFLRTADSTAVAGLAGLGYTPYASLGNEQLVRNSVTFKSSSKSFNLAAMKCAYMFSSNASYLQRIKTAHRVNKSRRARRLSSP